MHFTSLIAGLSGAVAAAALDVPAFPFTDHQEAPSAHKIPSRYESAVMGRRILALSKLADLATVFPDPSRPKNAEDADATHDDGLQDSASYRPENLTGVPISLMDYVADCETEGNPTLLAIKIATSFRNVEAGSNITLSMRWIPPYAPSKRIATVPLLSRLAAYVPFLSGGLGESPYNGNAPAADRGSAATPDPVPYSAANLPRFSLLGYLEPIKPDPVTSLKLATCFVAKHRDAKWWLPGNAIHESSWARLVVTQVYWVGGFGDRAYIGWIPAEEWNSVTKEEWSAITLPGEKSDWSEWSFEAGDEL